MGKDLEAKGGPVKRSLEQSSLATKRSRSASTPTAIKIENVELSPCSTLTPAFEQLIRLHKSLCTIYTFLSARQHFITSFDKLEPTVSSQIGRSLIHLDVAKIKAIIPKDLLFNYVVIEPEDREQENVELKPNGSDPQPVLLIEFVDGKLRATPDDPQVRTLDHAQWKSLRLPSYGVSAMKKLIEKRVGRFEKALQKYMKSHGDAWATQLEKDAAEYLPHLVITEDKSDPVEAMITAIHHHHHSTEADFDIPKFVQAMKNSPEYQDQIVRGGEFTVPKQNAVYGDLNTPLLPTLQSALDEYLLGNDEDDDKPPPSVRLYSHQAEAINQLEAGHNVVVATSTSSGKSLIYQIPILRALLNWHQHGSATNKYQRLPPTAIFIFPTKALAQDQMRAFNSLKSLLFDPTIASSITAETYDGDTTKQDRERIRQAKPSVIFTNPDMLHANILPNWEHPHWQRFLGGLRYVVLDELHTYTSVFGVHVAFVMRRLRRLCEQCSSATITQSFQVISCSATISEPESLMQEICGVESETIRVVSNDGSPAGQKHWVVWNSSYVSPEVPESGRVHPIQEATRLLVELTLRGVRTIAFCRVRRSCELLMKSVRNELAERNLDGENGHGPNIMAYRGGYSASDRRLIEHEMFSGRLTGIIATNALELGIDIGALDAVLIVGFPFSIGNLRQQSGRAGRRSQASLTILIGGGDPVDQHYMANPGSILTDPNEGRGGLMLDNAIVMENHLQCAAFELPINIDVDKQFFDIEGAGDKSLFAEIVRTKLDAVNDDDEEEEPDHAKYYTCDSKYLPYPSSLFSLRSLGGGASSLSENEDFSVIDITSNRNTVIEQVEPSRVSFTLYEGGVFIHQGCSYLIKSVDPKARYATVEKRDLNWITKQRDYTDVDPARTDIVSALISSALLDGSVNDSNVNSQQKHLQVRYGLVSIKTVVFGFFKFTTSFSSQNGRNSKGYTKIIDAVEIPGPQQRPFEYDSNGFWINLPTELINLVKNTKNLSLAAGIHAAEHVILAVLPYYLSKKNDSDSSGIKANANDIQRPESPAFGSSNNYFRRGSGMPELGTECKAPEKEFKKTQSNRKRPARLIFYESSRRSKKRSDSVASVIINDNGTGIAKKAFTHISQIISKALHLISNCSADSGPCTVGCPACGVAMPSCTENNVVVSKPAAILILRYLSGIKELDQLLEGIPDGPEENLAGMKMADTIIECS